MSTQKQPLNDLLATRLITVSQYILVVVFGLLPIFFIPSTVASFAYSKILFVVVGVFLAVILYGFALLRSGVIRLQFSWAPMMLWVIALIALTAALLSGDFRDALIGETFEVHTTLFVALLALTSSAWMILGTNKVAIMRLFMFFAGSTILLSLFHISRLAFGADFFSLGIFKGDPTLSPFGGWNDLAIFFGLAIILSLVALEQLRLTRLGQVVFGLVVAVALAMLAVINFFAVWMVLGLISLVVLIYGLTKDRFNGKTPAGTRLTISTVSIFVSLAVFISSTVFILGGSVVGNAVARLATISYMEVRPSLGATTNIVKQIYGSKPFFGVGPNRFSDVWRYYKDPSINESIFWNTDFVAGFGYIPTFFATTGIVGGVAWIVFLALFLFTGLRMLLYSAIGDRLWYFIGTVAFVGGFYIWILTVIYVPGPVLLLTAAVCTGLLSAAYSTLMQKGVHEMSTYGNRRIAFVLIALFLVLTIGSVSSVYFIGKHYAGVYVFNSSFSLITQGASLDDIEAKTIQAYVLSSDDSYARKLAEYQIARMGNLLGVTEPTEEQKEQFNTALDSAINAAQVAVVSDGTDPRNVSILGNVYATLVPGKIAGAYERSLENLTKAKELDPHNPLHFLGLGQLAFAAGREEEARSYVNQAIALKSNYSDAIFFLAQMDIAAGKTDDAILASRAITVFEPQNPVRFFQLGVLLFGAKRQTEAMTALEKAITLDQNYANAHFYLALVYDVLHRTQDARRELNAILALNPGHELILNLLRRLDQGEPLLEAQAAPKTSIPEVSSVKEEDGSVTASSTPDTPLVSPVNTSSEKKAE
jgi:tetratricopeptide (TPR) repeat protein